MPGFTHLQIAQPVTFGHHLLAWFEMLSRDAERLVDCRKRVNRLPLGAAALAGTTYPIDRERWPRKLWASTRVAATRWTPSPIATSPSNSARRPAIVDDAPVALLRRAGAVDQPAASASSICPTASAPARSIMPQKKNPDVPELVRGKTGRVVRRT